MSFVAYNEQSVFCAEWRKMQLLRNLLQHVSYESVKGETNRIVSGICCHSGKVKKDGLFVCISGYRANGHEYIPEALAQGAGVIVADYRYVIESSQGPLILTEHMKVRISDMIHQENVTMIFVRDTRRALSELSAAFYDFPATKLKMIGITGTSGKTTTAYLTAGILKQAGYKTGLIGTICSDDGKIEEKGSNTTPESCEIHRLLAQMVENGCDCCVMEVSSQGIALQRTRNIFFDIGVFLNIEPDHIGKGEHASFTEYLYCKSQLMRQCCHGIVNQDDPNVYKILAGHTCGQVETFALRYPSDVMAEQIQYAVEEGRLTSTFTVQSQFQKYTVKMQLPGEFNVYNALAAITVAGHFDVTAGQIRAALWKQQIPGRCENLTREREYVFLVDYAHNEMSLKNLLTTLRVFHPGRLIVIFGCGGDRSKLRRCRMGEVAGRLADYTILTSDNPRWEKPERIIDQIEEGILRVAGKEHYRKITDRREAVHYAVCHAQAGDILVLAGKGHEDYQEIKGVRYPLDDRRLIQEETNGGVRKCDC